MTIRTLLQGYKGKEIITYGIVDLPVLPRIGERISLLIKGQRRLYRPTLVYHYIPAFEDGVQATLYIVTVGP